MALRIETFNNTRGGQSLFKALGHPLVKEKVQTLLRHLQNYKKLAIYDPDGYSEALAELYDLSALTIAGYYGQKIENKGKQVLGFSTKLITELENCDGLLIVSFEALTKRLNIAHLIPEGCQVHTLDEVRLEETYLTHPKKYLDPLNFATNFAFFREEDGLHTRLTTTNYWSLYSGKPASLFCCLLDAQGLIIAQWMQDLGPPQGTVILDSREIKKRFHLADFQGQLFLHVIGAAGHDIVKYALDIFNDDQQTLSCTHDANAWPADLYSGLPAPEKDEHVILWIQNSHPCPIPAQAIGLNLMGEEAVVRWPESVPPYGTKVLDVASLFPEAIWPSQLEITAGKYFVRPRYEIQKRISVTAKRFIAHVNVERTDLKPDPFLPHLTPDFGKGFILVAPLLPVHHWQSFCLPTPMATTQRTLPLALEVYDATGKKVLRESLGLLKRDTIGVVDILDLLSRKGSELSSGYGHIELMYDFTQGEEADGWLHALFRYRSFAQGHTADTSFGSHIFNTPITYKNQPLSYKGTPPGLTTRLFLRLAFENLETHIHLIYPVSKTWHPQSQTQFQLMTQEGKCIAVKEIQIPCNGSFYCRISGVFESEILHQAGPNAYVIIRDETCRLFGYHGIIEEAGSFSLDHMFGF